MNWGKSIILTFALFALFIATLVTICVRQDISLVSTDYYRQELVYGEQMSRMKNAHDLSIRPQISLDGDSIVIDYADFIQVAKGELVLFRPSDARFDMTFNIAVGGEVRRSFDVSMMPTGMYKAKLRWTMGTQEYYMEEIVQL